MKTTTDILISAEAYLKQAADHIALASNELQRTGSAYLPIILENIGTMVSNIRIRLFTHGTRG